MSRKIIHLDMDAFYASVEQRDFPELRGKPVIVGGSPDSRGVVCTASYEARKFGVSSAMPSSRAKRLCPEGIFIHPRFPVYSEVSRQVMEIFRRFTDLVEPLSLDEAFLDVTSNKLGYSVGREAAAEIKRLILAETGLTATAGVAPNKFLAKIASGMNKPDGLTVVAPSRIQDFLSGLPVRKLPGVGRVTEEKMNLAGIHLVTDMQARSEAEMAALFGKCGVWFKSLSRGEDDRPVCADRERRSIGCEDTFAADLTTVEQAEQELRKIAAKLADRLERKDARGRTITLKVTYADFEKITRSISVSEYHSAFESLFSCAMELVGKTEIGSRPYRLLGLTVSNLESEEEEIYDGPVQLSLWPDLYGRAERRRA